VLAEHLHRSGDLIAGGVCSREQQPAGEHPQFGGIEAISVILGADQVRRTCNSASRRLPPLLSGGFSPSEARNADVIATLNRWPRRWNRNCAVAAQVAARVEDVHERAAAIDWS
jgi:hypothetical protein